MEPMTIVVVNHSSRASSDLDAEWCARLLKGLANQMDRDFCPDYELVPPTLVDSSEDATGTTAELAIFDTSDQARALGYHLVTPNGQPYGKVFADGQTPAQIETTASHELCEMVEDVDADAYRLAANGVAYADEACDAVEDQTYADPDTGVMLSDYVLRSWYVIGSAGPWDKLGILTADHQKTAEGYWIEDDGGAVTTNPPEARSRKGKEDPGSRTAQRIAKGKARASRHGDLNADLAQLRATVAALEAEKRSRPSASAPTEAPGSVPPVARRVHLGEIDPEELAHAERTATVDMHRPGYAAPAPAKEGEEEALPARRVHLEELPEDAGGWGPGPAGEESPK